MNASSAINAIRWPRAILVGICAATAIVCIIFGIIRSSYTEDLLSLDEALWVSDWNITTIYGPGTKEQRTIVQKLRSTGREFSEFDAPVLYRMGGNYSMNSSEGIVMIPFDPLRPQGALALKAESTPK